MVKSGLFFVTLAFFLGLQVAHAQKFGYVDTEFITSKMPDYQKALTEIDKFADKWSKDIQDKYLEIEKLQKAFQAEEILLTEDMKRDRLRIISDKEREAREYNNRVFGFEGMLFQKKKEIVKPVMETVMRAIEKVSAQKRLDFVFDKASDLSMLYTNPRHDYTDYVLEELGLVTDQRSSKPAVNETTELNPDGNSKSNNAVKPAKQPK